VAVADAEPQVVTEVAFTITDTFMCHSWPKAMEEVASRKRRMKRSFPMPIFELLFSMIIVPGKQWVVHSLKKRIGSD
jgi:hypothetical protein